MSPDDAAWASIADAVEAAIEVPGLSPPSKRELTELHEACRRCARQPLPAPAEPQRDWAADAERRREMKRTWRATSPAVREHVVLEAIGDERMSVWELSAHLIRTRPDIDVTEACLRKLLRTLVDVGELQEVDEFPPTRADGGRQGGTRRRRVYFRDGELSGPIAGLERAFHAASHDNGRS